MSFSGGGGGASRLPPSEGERAGARLLRQERTRAAGHPNLSGRGAYILGYMRGRDGEGTAKVRGGRAPTAQAAGAGTRLLRQERARAALWGGSGWFGALRGWVRRDAFLAPGCSIIRASLTVALMVSLPRFGSLWAFGPTAHRADASLRALRALATLGPSPVRRKDGPCHSERRVGMGPARKRADTKKIKGTARAALEGPHVRTTAQRGRPLTAAERARRRYVGY